jgi:hypothetical protein
MTLRLVRRSTDHYAGRHHHVARVGWLKGVAILGFILASIVSVVALQLPGAEGAYLARITNSTNSAGINPYFTCGAAVTKDAAGAAYFAYPFGDNGLGALAGVVADVSGNGRTGAYGVGGITFGVSSGICRNDNKSAITFDGSSGYVTTPYPALAIPSTPSIAAPTTFSVEVWFQTTTAQGKLIGFGNARTGASTGTQDDRSLYINTAGKLVFGLYNGGYQVITSPSAVTDGNWHYAVATVTSTGSTLYLDGQSVSSANNVAAAPYQGYWRIGYDSLTGWPLAGTNYFFKGSMAWAAVYTYPLTALQVAQHYAAGK